MKNKDTSIVIEHVKNGFIIRPPSDPNGVNWICMQEDVMVFNSLDDLNAWLHLHFDRTPPPDKECNDAASSRPGERK